MSKGTSKEKTYWYYIVERAYPARISTDQNEFGGAILHRDGTWHPYNALKIAEDGCMVSEADALTFWDQHRCSILEDHVSPNLAEDSSSDARAVEPWLRSVSDQKAEAAGGEASSGIALKPKDSLERKIKLLASMGHTDAMKMVSDALRGSIIVDRPEQIAPAAAALCSEIEAGGGRIVFDNKFEHPNKFGYAAVHGDALLKSPVGGQIRAEVQIHLRAINDGTLNSVKETARQIYRDAQAGKIGEPAAVRKIQRLYRKAFQEALKQ